MTTMLLRNKHMLGLDRSETLHFTYNCIPRTKARCSVERETHGVSVCTAYVFRRTPMPRYAGIRCRLGDTRTPRRRSVSA